MVIRYAVTSGSFGLGPVILYIQASVRIAQVRDQLSAHAANSIDALTTGKLKKAATILDKQLAYRAPTPRPLTASG